MTSGGALPLLGEAIHHCTPSLSHDVRRLSSSQTLGIPLPPRVFSAFNPVFQRVNLADLFQMPEDLVIPETAPKAKADEDWNSSASWEPAVLFTVKQMGQEEGA